jgi:alpha-beta hydrolase superfamily lysophospholipase
MKKEILKCDSIPAILWGTKSDGIYIYVHGRHSGKEEAQGFAEKAIVKGYQVLSFDLPEHGERKNENYLCMVCNGVHDLRIIAKYVQKNWRDICLYANSLGAYFSLLAYNDLSFGKCLFLSPILDMKRLIENMMKWYSISEEMLREKRKIPTPMNETLYWDYYCFVKENPVNKWDVPTEILYGSKDNLTERETVESFSERFGCNLTVLEGSEHWFHSERQLNCLYKWLDKHIYKQDIEVYY